MRTHEISPGMSEERIKGRRDGIQKSEAAG